MPNRGDFSTVELCFVLLINVACISILSLLILLILSFSIKIVLAF